MFSLKQKTNQIPPATIEKIKKELHYTSRERIKMGKQNKGYSEI